VTKIKEFKLKAKLLNEYSMCEKCVYFRKCGRKVTYRIIYDKLDIGKYYVCDDYVKTD